jgi:cellobionic acid phosphorylase
MSQNTTCGFNQDGDRFSLFQPRFMENADTDLWNDRFSLHVSHRGTVSGRVFTPNPQAYAESLRPVYCLEPESGQFHSLTWGPVFSDPETFRFEIGLDQVSWHQESDGLSSTLSLAVPREAALEAWHLELRNRSGRHRELVLVPVIPVGLPGLLSQEAALESAPFGIRIDYFPYYVQIADHEKMARRWNTTFACFSREPEDWTTLERSFLGFGDWSRPEGLSGPLDRACCHYERAVLAARFPVELAPGESFSLGWTTGPAPGAGEARTLTGRFPPETAFSQASAEQARFLEARSSALRLQGPDRDFDSFINHWAPARSVRIGRTFRLNPSPQARNAIQDSMAMAFFDPDRARSHFLRIWEHQQADGFMPHGLPMHPDAEIMPITRIPHKDTNAWGPLALDLYLRETGDASILAEPVPFVDRGTAPLAAHIEAGLRWLLADRTARGLSRIGQGDWNDPLNMAGPEGKGESVWLTEALAVALEYWSGICQRWWPDGDPAGWRAEAEACRQAVRDHAWDGRWFLRAISDDGTPIGSSRNPEGALFLNAQSWALMAAIPDPEQEASILGAVAEHLDTRIAPAVLGPPYQGMRPHVGKLTLKSPGTGENGSIYCHAALFWSHALFLRGHHREGWRVLRNLIPGGPGNTVGKAGQVPLYIPNFYRGPAAPEVFGQSSHAADTGSAAWVHRVVIEQVAGLRGDGDGLHVDPFLPPDWPEMHGIRRFRGTPYTFSVRRDPSVSSITVSLNGQPAGQRIPWRPADSPQELDIRLPG